MPDRSENSRGERLVRGVRGGLSGFAEAIRAAYPQTKIQRCIVHLVRAALKYVTDKDSGPLIGDLKMICRAASIPVADEKYDELEQKWSEEYPTIGRSRR